MLNKFNQQGAGPFNRVVPSRSLKSQSKLTVFMVYKMIEKRKQQQTGSNNKKAASIPNNEITSSREIFSQDLIQKQYRQKINPQRRKQEIIQSAKYSKRTRCHTQLQGNSIDPIFVRRQQNVMTAKSIATQQSSQINRLIIQKLKRVVNKNDKDKRKDKNFKLEDFGLNITQIKRVDQPQRRQTLKQRLNNNNNNNNKQYRMGEEEICSIHPVHNKRILHAKRSLMKHRLEYKQINEQDRQFMESIKFKSLDNSYNKWSGKKLKKQIHNYTYKLHKMFDCLDIILNSYHSYLNLSSPAQQKQQSIIHLHDHQIKNKPKLFTHKYQFYVGNGNNSNLIRSILRKRSWWSETTHINKANLVWTQLKMPQILSKLKQYKESWLETFIPFQQQIQQKQQKSQASLLRNSGKKSCTTDNTDSIKMKESLVGLIFHEKQDKRYYSVLNIKEVGTRLEKIGTPEVIHNHYEQNYMFGNKNALYYNIAMYYEFQGKLLSDIVPPTYYLEKSNHKSMAQFEKVFTDLKKKGSIWIVKPAENSNRGQGIVVTSALNQIKSNLNLHKKVIVQSYIKNLLLYNGRKFDIRVYMVASTIHGRLKVYWYDEGYIRTSSEHYDLNNLFDSYIHLTNDAIQKTGENYGKYQQGNKLSYSQFQRYLEARFPKDNIHIYDIHNQMKQLARQAVRAIYCRLQNHKRQFSFELFGLDFIIDSNFRPTLIQINTNPCLQLSSSSLERLIPRMMENIFRLCIDPIFRPKIECSYSRSESYYIYDETFLERNKFSLIFDEKYDRNFEWQQKCKKMSGIEWGQGQQQEYEDDGNIIVVDY